MYLEHHECIDLSSITAFLKSESERSYFNLLRRMWYKIMTDREPESVELDEEILADV